MKQYLIYGDKTKQENYTDIINLFAHINNGHLVKEFAEGVGLVRDCIEIWDLNNFKELIELGADVEVDNCRILKMAAKLGKLDILCFLLENFDFEQSNLNDAFLTATERQRIDCANLLLLYGANCAGHEKELLYYACRNNQIDLLALIVDKYPFANIDTLIDNMKTHKDAVAFNNLMQLNVDFNGVQCASKDKLLNFAIELGATDEFRRLCENCKFEIKEDTLNKAISEGRFDIVAYILKNNVPAIDGTY